MKSNNVVSINASEYVKQLDEYITNFNSMILQGEAVEVEDVVKFLVSSEDNSKIRRWATQQAKLCTTKQFDAALAKEVRKQQIVDMLGCYPTTPRQFVEAYMKKNSIVTLCNGIILRTGLKYMTMHDGSKEVITDEMAEADRDLNRYNQIMNDSEQPMHELSREIRVFRDDLNLGHFKDMQVGDALGHLIAQQKRQRLYDLTDRIFTVQQNLNVRAEVEEKWVNLVRAAFDIEHGDEDEHFVVAVLKNFIYQVKRKITNRPVFDHLMPIILGAQGIGKSVFLEKFLKPIEELAMPIDFSMLNEDKTFGMYDAYVWKFDEMGGIDKIEAEKLKNKLTTDRVVGRPMRTNDSSIMKQNATAIGASNKVVAQMINDTTGIRRFVEIRYKAKADYKVVNTTDFLELWASVDEMGVDPMTSFKAILKVQQAANTNMSGVEQWIQDMQDTNQLMLLRKKSNSDRLDGKELYEMYKAYAVDHCPKSMFSYPGFRAEMRRLITNDTTGKFPFVEKPRGNDGYKYRLI